MTGKASAAGKTAAAATEKAGAKAAEKAPAKDAVKAPAPAWSIEDSIRLYGLDTWGRDFFTINEKGHVVVGPRKNGGPSVDLKELVDELSERGIATPLLIRFSDLLRSRIDEIHGAFRQAIQEFHFRGDYRGVYPIKVNQDRFLVQDLVDYGRPYHYGLEAGSKPELLGVMAMLADEEALVICNGYKDEEYVETALLASQLGPKVILVVEKPSELPLIVSVARRTGIRPRIGFRARLSTRGAGHWEASGGDRSKFGLSAREMLEGVAFLKEEQMLDTLLLLHFHLGSQISSIRNVKDALREGSWLYVNLVKAGVDLIYFDVGGGLGIDYDGSSSSFNSSINYSLQEYANDVVYGVMEVFDSAGVRHPILVTEAGRATVAHHALLVLDVLGVREFTVGTLPPKPPEGAEPALRNLIGTYQELETRNLRETYHDALQYRDECLSLFNLGHLSLEHRVLAEDVFWGVCARVRQLLGALDKVPRELQEIEQQLADTYFCNFSVFQSVPDSWAIDQLFPILPIHRLGEEPLRRAVIADITCDSDGKIDRFIDPHQSRSTLPLHPWTSGEPYYIGIFLVGAYQEILGDLHNLLGDTHTIHVGIVEGGYHIEHVVPGDTVTEVLRYVGYHRDELIANVRRSSEAAIRADRLTREQARHILNVFQSGLAGYTYLERE